MDTFEDRDLSIISDCILQLAARNELSISKLLSTCEVDVTKEKLQQLRRSAFKGKIPTKILREELRDWLCPFGNLQEGQEVYAQVNFPESEEELHSDIVSISLITPSMLKADHDYFAGTNRILNIIYTPYSYRFISFPPYEVTPDNCYFGQVQEWVKEVNGGDTSLWFRGILYDRKQTAHGDTYLHGVVEYAEGRPISREAYLYILREPVPAEITSCYDIDSILSGYDFGAAEDTINALFNPPESFRGGDNPTRSGGEFPKSLYKIKIYNTGQGNCIYISPSSKSLGTYCKRFFFDVGKTMLPPAPKNIYHWKTPPYSTDLQRTAVKLGIGDAARCMPDFIILSHWHKDHYNIAYNSRSLAMCPWIAPQIEKRDKSLFKDNDAKRLVRYLYKNRLLHFVSSSYTNKMICANNVFSLWRGKRATNPFTACDDPNADCLLLQMSQTLLPADCIYPNWPDGFAKVQPFRHFIVPHHGSYFSNNAHCSSNRVLPPRIKIALSQTGMTYICAGMDSQNHPNDLHMEGINKHLCTTVLNWDKNSNIWSADRVQDPFIVWDDV